MRKCVQNCAKRDAAGVAGIRPGFFTFVGYQRGGLDRPSIGDYRLHGRATIVLNSLAGRPRGRLRGAAVAAFVAVALSGCGTITAQTGTSAYVAPGKFDVYTCSDINDRTQYVEKRKAELEQLMGRAADGVGGGIVNTIAYRGEYLQTRDELTELSRASADKQCATKSQWSSGRAVF